MHMSFYFSSKVYDFLFYGVNITTTWGMVSLCLGLVSLSILAEGFKVARSQLLKVAMSRRTGCTKYEVPERIKFHILQSFLHVIHLTIGYILMLIVMTYNAYFSIAIIGGAGLGYFFFALFDLPSKILGTSRTAVRKRSNSHTQGAEVVLLQGQEKNCNSTEQPETAPSSPQEADARDRGSCSTSVPCGNCGDSSCGGCTLHRRLDAVAIQAPDTFNPV
ncbi:high affinity copper uptake protein 1 isoform X6 [Penaeus vannamei]|uniref:high affinity copper uptake protein 1 isoform X6 n=1 Tax=Penaeus vannamei TaxID=6689 RepID=UPI00387F5CA6